jgi:hypothetical protein
MKLLSGAIFLACVPFALAGSNAAYPTEKVASFVVQQLDLTTFPSELRPKREKGKKTLADYGYMTRNEDENEELIKAAHGTTQFTIRILEQNQSGIYVCASGLIEDAGSTHFQRVLLLKRKDANGLLKSRETVKEFDGCPMTGGQDDNPPTN